jgi:hypothetical protein
LKNVADHRHCLFDALNLFQQFDILGAKVGGRRGKLHRTWSGENNFRAQIGSASLQIVGHASSKSRKKHYQAHSQSDAGDAD